MNRGLKSVILTAALLFGVGAGTCLALSPSLPPHLETMGNGFRYGFPPQVEKNGLVFAGSVVPIHRPDVRSRVLKEINYLLQDRRSRVLAWLNGADALAGVIGPILRQYDIPADFIYLAAIESSYNSRALSSAGAYGYWQFIRPTAGCPPKGCDKYNWKMIMCDWKDERADLVRSTHGAARYLAWLNRVKKVSVNGQPDREGFNDWLLTCASYNAGPGRVTERLNSFGAVSYWDVPLPIETERYVPRWIATALIGRYRNFYGVQIPRSRTVAFDTVEKIRLKKDLSFVAMARLLDTNPRVVWSLNTQVAPEKGLFPARSGSRSIEHRINVPRGTRSKFIAQLAAHGYTK